MEPPFEYAKTTLEHVPCNLCEGNSFFVLARQSKEGLLVETVLCRRCSLIYINPRMVKEGYDRYYKYHYRLDRSSNNDTKPELTTIKHNFTAASKFGVAIGRRYHQYFREGLTIDVGSSTGGMLFGLKEEIPHLRLLGIEPSIAESEYAISRGIPTRSLLFEDFHGEITEKAANILCMQSLNHLLDPMKFLKWARDTLQDDGHLFLAVKNFRHQVRRAGDIESGIQIDHPYMFIPETLKRMVEVAGFDVIDFDVDERKSRDEIARQKQEGFNIHHIRLVARRADKPAPRYGLINSRLYRRMRSELSPLAVKLYYLLHHSRLLAPVRKLFS